MAIVTRYSTLLMLVLAVAGCGGAASSVESRESINCPPNVAAWASGTTYAAGALVTYNGTTYRCRQAHAALDNWTPDAVLALWLPVDCIGGGDNNNNNDVNGDDNTYNTTT